MEQIPVDKPAQPRHPLEMPPSAPAQPPPKPMVRVTGPNNPTVAMMAIIGVNVVVYLFDVFSGYTLTIAGAKVNEQIINHGEFWRLVTPIFLHAGIIHLGLNCYGLYLFGKQIEKAFGTWRFLTLYLLSGIGGVVASLAFSTGASIGASGAVFGLIGAMLPFIYHNRAVLANPSRGISEIILLILFNLGYGLVNNFIAVQSSGIQIDNWGHVGGLIAGLAMGWFIAPRFQLVALAPDHIKLNDTISPASTLVVGLITASILVGAVVLIIALNRLGL